jgi:uncharacterized coiled-coil protein SlyX
MSATSSRRICEWQSTIGYAAVTFDHIALSDATEILAKRQWYDIRNTVLIGRASLSIFAQRENSRSAKRPLSQSSARHFWDVGHAAVNAMLLSEFLKAHRKVQEQAATIARLTCTDAKQEAMIASQQKQIEALTAGLQKVSAQLEVSTPAPQTAKNTE